MKRYLIKTGHAFCHTKEELEWCKKVGAIPLVVNKEELYEVIL